MPERIKQKIPGNKHTYKLYPSSQTISFVEAIKLLTQKPTSREQIAEHTGVSQATIVRWFRALESRELIYVALWKKAGNQPVAYYMFGHPVNSEPRPAPLKNAEYSRNYRARKRAEKNERNKD